MVYGFDSRIAELYGVDEAVFIHNLYFWILKNEANGRHDYDGRSWTYNSMRAFTQLFPFWSRRQIERIINNLKAKGAIHVGNYNPAGFDRTQWYALDETVYCIYANGDTHLTERGHPFPQTVTPIPDSKPNSKPDSKHRRETFSKPTLEEVRAYCEERHNGIDPEKFYDYYESQGWLVGKSRMKDWKAAMRNWERREGQNKGGYSGSGRSKAAPAVENSSLDMEEYTQWERDYVPVYHKKEHDK